MNSISRLALIALVLFSGLVGCRSRSKPDVVRGAFEEEQEEVGRTLRAIFAAAEKKDLDRLEAYHLFGPKFTKFSERGPRQDADGTRHSERRDIGGLTAFRPTLEDVKTDVFGPVAIATFTLRYEAVTSEETVNGTSRATIVLVKVNEDWRITHEHFSPSELEARNETLPTEVRRLKVIPSKWYDRPCLVVRSQDLEQYSPATILIIAERVGAYTWLHAPVDLYIVQFPDDDEPRLWTADDLVDEVRRRTRSGDR